MGGNGGFAGEEEVGDWGGDEVVVTWPGFCGDVGVGSSSEAVGSPTSDDCLDRVRYIFATKDVAQLFQALSCELCVGRALCFICRFSRHEGDEDW